MGFADYFSKNPNGIATLPSDEDTNFIINQVNDFNFTLLKYTLRNNSQYANNQPNKYDVMEQTQRKQINEHAFCHFRLRNMSLTLNTQKFQTDKFSTNKYKEIRDHHAASSIYKLRKN